MVYALTKLLVLTHAVKSRLNTEKSAILQKQYPLGAWMKADGSLRVNMPRLTVRQSLYCPRISLAQTLSLTATDALVSLLSTSPDGNIQKELQRSLDICGMAITEYAPLTHALQVRLESLYQNGLQQLNLEEQFQKLPDGHLELVTQLTVTLYAESYSEPISQSTTS